MRDQHYSVSVDDEGVHHAWPHDCMRGSGMSVKSVYDDSDAYVRSDKRALSGLCYRCCRGDKPHRTWFTKDLGTEVTCLDCLANLGGRVRSEEFP